MDIKEEKVNQIIKNLPGKSSGFFDGNHYYYDKKIEKYYSVDIDYNIDEISKNFYDSI
jgi:uncharacterized protein (DUF2147 family)